MDAIEMKRYRGVILALVDVRHKGQMSRLDNLSVLHILLTLKHAELGQQQVDTVLQDLRDRGYLAFKQERNRVDGKIEISQIQITPKGRDLLESTITDEAVFV